eukprot:254068-Hanusia_phi.AAC.5
MQGVDPAHRCPCAERGGAQAILHRTAVATHGTVRADAAAQRGHAAEGDAVHAHAAPQDRLDPARAVRAQSPRFLP